jgi:restriction system protein
MDIKARPVFTDAKKEELRKKFEYTELEREITALENIDGVAAKHKAMLEANRVVAIQTAAEQAQARVKRQRRYAAQKKMIADQDILEKKIDRIIEKHSTVLILKFRKRHLRDEYGISTLDKSGWENDLGYFISKVLQSELNESEFNGLDINFVAGKIHNYIKSKNNELKKPDETVLSGIEFEVLCANKLKSFGWSTSLTQGSGDQGIDIIATKQKVVVVLQCKRYAGTVGNKAVQEVLGGKAMISADFAAVVTNSTYTKSARQLAASSGVKLLHIDQLSQLDELIDARSER